MEGSINQEESFCNFLDEHKFFKPFTEGTVMDRLNMASSVARVL